MDDDQLLLKKMKHKKRVKRVRSLIIWLLILSAVGYFGYRSKSKLKMPENSMALPKQESYEEVYLSRYTDRIDLSGFVEAGKLQTLLFRATGTITEVNVAEGDLVKKGEVLARMDDTAVRVQLKELDNAIKEAGIVGDKRNLELLEMKKENTENLLEYTTLVANFDGVVAESSIEVGDYYSAGDKAMTVIDRSFLKAKVDIDEIDMRGVEEGMTAQLYFDALGGASLDAVITYIPTLGTYTREGIGVKKVEFTIFDPPEALAPGYSFTGNLESESSRELILLPQSAVHSKEGRTYVTRLNGEEKEEVEVKTHYLGEGVCSLLRGDLEVGDTLVVMKNKGAQGAMFGAVEMSSEAGN